MKMKIKEERVHGNQCNRICAPSRWRREMSLAEMQLYGFRGSAGEIYDWAEILIGGSACCPVGVEGDDGDDGDALGLGLGVGPLHQS